MAWALLLAVWVTVTGGLGRAAAFSIPSTSTLSLRPSARPPVRWLRARGGRDRDRAALMGVAGVAGVAGVVGAGAGGGDEGRGELSPSSDSMDRPSITLKVALDSAGGVDDLGDKDSFRFTW